MTNKKPFSQQQHSHTSTVAPLTNTHTSHSTLIQLHEHSTHTLIKNKIKTHPPTHSPVIQQPFLFSFTCPRNAAIPARYPTKHASETFLAYHKNSTLI